MSSTMYVQYSSRTLLSDVKPELHTNEIETWRRLLLVSRDLFLKIRAAEDERKDQRARGKSYS